MCWLFKFLDGFLYVQNIVSVFIPLLLPYIHFPSFLISLFFLPITPVTTPLEKKWHSLLQKPFSAIRSSRKDTFMKTSSICDGKLEGLFLCRYPYMLSVHGSNDNVISGYQCFLTLIHLQILKSFHPLSCEILSLRNRRLYTCLEHWSVTYSEHLNHM